ncbi:MAG: hypothetical protein HYX34_01500 [Actinobacteria bacterium]|nr:hypothetical protein [Actinomycetota bacterium]
MTVADAAPTSVAAPSASPSRTPSWVAWSVGAAAALVAVGPGLGPGAWLNVDLVVTPVTPVPRGVWGLGPELPRRVPYALPLAWISAAVPGTLPTKLLMVASLAAAVAGAWRLTERWFGAVRPLAGAGAGLGYGLSPFLLTRLGVGHLPLVVAAGILPWALPRLLRPLDETGATFRWATALGLAGFFGGTLAVPALLVGAAASVRSVRGALRTLGVLVGSQLPWVMPGIAVAIAGGRAEPAPAGGFRTDTAGPGGVLRLLAGHGFWRGPASQVGGDQGWVVPILGVALFLLALAGLARLGARWRTPAIVLAAVGLLVPLASALPGVRSAYDALADVSVLAVLREGQRVLPLYLVVALPLAAAGADRLADLVPGWREGLLAAAPVAAALVLAGPGLWGVDGALSPVRLGPEWAAARRAVARAPGPVLSLPFERYSRLGAAGGRVVLDPAAIALGGDVITSSDPGFRRPAQEVADPRETAVRRLLRDLRGRRSLAPRLAELGVRWVLLSHADDYATYTAIRGVPGVGGAAGMRDVVHGRDLELLEVERWSGPARLDDGRAASLAALAAPFVRPSTRAPLTWARPGSRGWLRGWRAAGTTRDGLLRLPGGAGPVWYWPAALVLLADAGVGAALAYSWRQSRRQVGTPVNV